MPTARLLSALDDLRLDDGTRLLQAPLRADLGVFIQELHAWDPAGVYVSLSETGTTILTIPAGSTSNYSSVPSIVPEWLVGRWDQHDVAGFVHDLLYHLGAPRGPSDQVWRILARSGTRHVNAVQGWFGYAGLRVGGWVRYRELRRAARERRE